MALVLSLLAGLLPMNTALAASRITITSIYVTDEPAEISNGKPSNDALVPRTTNSTHNLLATIEGITDAQIPGMYMQITNVTNGNTITERAITPQKTGSFSVQFNGVPLTEGLNRIVVKLDGANAVESAPGWIYYTATTSVTNLRVNGETFSENRFFPSNPNQSTVINLSGRANNATQVQAYLFGGSNPINGYFNQGEFYFIGDDINKGSTTANLQLRPGDNPLTLLATNATKTFQLQRTLIYDNGGPFAFQSTIQDATLPARKQLLVNNPVVQTSNVTVESLLKVDLDTNGQPEYRYVDVYAAGERFGPYDISGASAAERATDLFPKAMNEGHGVYDLTLTGTELHTTRLYIQDNTGNLAETELTGATVTADGTRKVFPLPVDLTAAGSPYKVTAKKANGTTILNEFAINVIRPGALPEVTDISFNGGDLIREGNTNGPTNTVTFAATPAFVAAEAFSIQITDLLGNPAGVVANSDITGRTNGTTSISFKLPATLLRGDYKLRIVYSGYTISEKSFAIDAPVAQDPTITSVVSGNTAVSVAGAPANRTYLFVNGSGFGTDEAVVSGRLIDAVENPIPLTLAYLENDLAVFELPDQAAVVSNVQYDLDMDTPGNDPANATNVMSGLNFGSPDPNYDGKIVTNVSPLQVTVGDLATPAGAVTLTGDNLNNTTGLLSAQVLNEDGTTVATPVVTNLTDTSGTLTIPVIAAGSYILRIMNTHLVGGMAESIVIAQYPFSVTDPEPTAMTPNVMEANDPNPERALTVQGTQFGRDKNAYDLRFTGGTASVTMPAVQVLDLNKIIFDAPSTLAVGTYQAQLLYNGSPIGAPLAYTVSTPAASMRENAQWSKPGEYRVYEFNANLALPTDRVQTLEFRFYNLPTDNVPPTSFTFRYENANLPYIEKVEISNGGTAYQISEAAVNEVNEQPTTLLVTTNNRALGLNAYFGGYSGTVTPTAARRVSDLVANGRTYHRFEVTLNGLPNGEIPIAFVPRSSDVPSLKTGENLAGRSTFTFNVSSTPYVIVNNLHTGLVVKDIVELRCGVTTQCVQGKLVNVSDYRQLQIVVNGTPFALDPGEYNNTTKMFNFRFGPGTTHLLPSAQAGNLLEGRNTIDFVIYEDIARTKVLTRASFEFFKFSTNAPEFLSLTPVENSDIIKYRPGSLANSFVTSEMAVSFAGQFANASEIRLTVKSVDPVTGTALAVYDRRYGSGFGLFEPATNNPNYFARINQPTNGQFATRTIPLSPKGDTVFEFAITNATNIVVTRTITITREPLPYIILSPSMSKNPAGVDQANINSNYVEFEIAAENADAVLFDGKPATMREVTDPSTGLRVKRFYYEVRNLRNGRNNVEFTVVRGQDEIDAEVVVFNVNTPIEGAQYKTPLSNRIRAFNGLVNLTFPRNTNLMRNDPSAINRFITSDRQILIGIANNQDGRVDKFKNPAPYDGQVGNPNPLIPNNAKLILAEPTGRFRSISPLIWIDAGTIPANETDTRAALTGSGRLPYDATAFYNRNQEDLVVPSQAGTLTLRYDANIRNDGWKYITVYHYDIFEDHRGIVGPRWRNIGGVVDPDDNTITVPVQRFGYYQVMYMDQSFDDVTTHSWARDQLDILYSRGIMLNKSNTSFVPNDPISRGEFATLLVKIFDIPLQYSERPTFTDVLRVNPMTNGLYDYKYIETAARVGIIRGAGGGRFQPDSAITRQDAAVMIARAANLRLAKDEKGVLADLQKAFTDANTIDIYARASILAVADEEFIVGKENVLLQGQRRATYRFDPNATFTRAEAAEVAIRVMEAADKLPN